MSTFPCASSVRKERDRRMQAGEGGRGTRRIWASHPAIAYHSLLRDRGHAPERPLQQPRGHPGARIPRQRSCLRRRRRRQAPQQQRRGRRRRIARGRGSSPVADPVQGAPQARSPGAPHGEGASPHGRLCLRGRTRCWNGLACSAPVRRDHAMASLSLSRSISICVGMECVCACVCVWFSLFVARQFLSCVLRGLGF